VVYPKRNRYQPFADSGFFLARPRRAYKNNGDGHEHHHYLNYMLFMALRVARFFRVCDDSEAVPLSDTFRITVKIFRSLR